MASCLSNHDEVNTNTENQRPKINHERRIIQVTVFTSEPGIEFLNNLEGLSCDTSSTWCEFFNLYSPSFKVDGAKYEIRSRLGKHASQFDQRVEEHLAPFKSTAAAITIHVVEREYDEYENYFFMQREEEASRFQIDSGEEVHGIITNVPCVVPVVMDHAFTGLIYNDCSPKIPSKSGKKSYKNFNHQIASLNRVNEEQSAAKIGENRRLIRRSDPRFRFNGVRDGALNSGSVFMKVKDHLFQPPTDDEDNAMFEECSTSFRRQFGGLGERKRLLEISASSTNNSELTTTYNEMNMSNQNNVEGIGEFDQKRRFIKKLLSPTFPNMDLRAVAEEVVAFKKSDKWLPFSRQLPRLSMALGYLFDSRKRVEASTSRNLSSRDEMNNNDNNEPRPSGSGNSGSSNGLNEY